MRKNHKLPPTTTRLECAFKRNELVKDSLLGTPALVIQALEVFP